MLERKQVMIEKWQVKKLDSLADEYKVTGSQIIRLGLSNLFLTKGFEKEFDKAKLDLINFQARKAVSE